MYVFFFAPLEPFDQNEQQLMQAMNVSALRQLQWATKVLRHLVVKFDFWSVLVTFCPLPPKTMLILPILRLHRPQRLHNIELGGRGCQRINASCKLNRTTA